MAACTSFEDEPLKVAVEMGVTLKVKENHATPEKTDTFYNPKMRMNREMVLCALATMAEEKDQLRCLDAFGATGIEGILWTKYLKSKQPQVTIGDIKEETVSLIRRNVRSNGFRVKTEDKKRVADSQDGRTNNEEGCSIDDNSAGRKDEEVMKKPEIEVVCCDANVLLHQRPFDFVHLDPYGCSVQYLDAAFRNVPKDGIVAVTSTDTSAVYGKCPNVTQRHYNGYITRSEFMREMAVRLILASVVRAAARCNKGVDVLLSLVAEHFLLVIVRVQRGPSYADACLERVQGVIHCQLCQERVFQPNDRMLNENSYTFLPCTCHAGTPGKTAALLGPVWSGPVFNLEFLKKMFLTCRGLLVSPTTRNHLKTMIQEAQCPAGKSEEDLDDNCQEAEENPWKKRKTDGEHGEPHPPFYYNIHRHCAKSKDSPKMQKILQYMRKEGYRASRTHFDPVAIRTDATLLQLKAVLQKYSNQTVN
ncbi:TRMT1-like protein [Branchiostoma floridae]|uniref:tRNA (guanine(26)-N(2))-dimethyltransferase n=1 Tax=Branchiostoma floridae TaxID=7739 RepID=A0A9J7LKK8_BRAFL|nr:TRMT1-like protein [Branchiostoma floridae]